MERVKHLGLEFLGDVDVFSPGDVVRGEVILVIEDDGGHGLERVKGLWVRMRGKARNQFSVSDYDGEYRKRTEKEHYFDQSIVLFGTGKHQRDVHNLSIPPGRQGFPFEFRLPNAPLPSPYKGSCGYIRYKVKATLSRIGMITNQKITFQKPFPVSGPTVDLNRIAGIQLPVHIDIQVVPDCCGCGSHVVEAVISFSLPRQGYVPGDGILVTGHVNNHEGKETVDLKAQLVQVFIHRAGHKSQTVHHKVARAYATVDCPKGQVTAFTVGTLWVPQQVPSTGLPGCNITDVEYYVQVNSCSSCKKKLPITIGTVPLPVAVPQYSHVMTSPSLSDTSGESSRLLQPSAPPGDYGSAPPNYEEAMETSVADVEKLLKQ